MTAKQETVAIGLMEKGIPPVMAQVEWIGRASYTTTRGKVKDTITGIPSQGYWQDRKNNAAKVKAEMEALNVTLRRIKKGEWELVLWVNKHNEMKAQAILEEIGQPF